MRILSLRWGHFLLGVLMSTGLGCFPDRPPTEEPAPQDAPAKPDDLVREHELADAGPAHGNPTDGGSLVVTVLDAGINEETPVTHTSADASVPGSWSSRDGGAVGLNEVLDAGAHDPETERLDSGRNQRRAFPSTLANGVKRPMMRAFRPPTVVPLNSTITITTIGQIAFRVPHLVVRLVMKCKAVRVFKTVFVNAKRITLKMKTAIVSKKLMQGSSMIPTTPTILTKHLTAMMTTPIPMMKTSIMAMRPVRTTFKAQLLLLSPRFGH